MPVTKRTGSHLRTNLNYLYTVIKIKTMFEVVLLAAENTSRVVIYT